MNPLSQIDAIPLELPSDLDHDEPTRALQLFIRSFFRPPLAQTFKLQIYVITAIIAFLIILGLSVSIARIAQGNFWVVRVQEVAHSRHLLIIPNAVLSFVVIEAVFGVIYLAYVWFLMMANERGVDVRNQGYWLVTVWLCLYAGAWSGAVGTFFAYPGILSQRQKLTHSIWARLMPNPWLCNAIFLGVPILVTSSVSAVTISLGSHWRSTYSMAQSFEAHLAQRSPAEQLTEGDRDRAIAIWRMFIKTWWYTSVGFALWAGWAFFLFIFYFIAGGKVAMLLRDELHRHLTFEKERIRKDGQKTLTRAQKGNAALSGHRHQWDKISHSRQGLGQASDDALRPKEQESDDEDLRREAESTFFPRIKADRVTTRAQRQPKIEVLKVALANTTLMWASVSSAVLSYGVLCTWTAIHAYSAAIEGPIALAKVFERYNSIAGWLACGFGGLNFIWVTSRTFEPVLEGLHMRHEGHTLQTIATFFSNSRLRHPFQDAAKRAAAAPDGAKDRQIAAANTQRVLPTIAEDVSSGDVISGPQEIMSKSRSSSLGLPSSKSSRAPPLTVESHGTNSSALFLIDDEIIPLDHQSPRPLSYHHQAQSDFGRSRVDNVRHIDEAVAGVLSRPHSSHSPITSGSHFQPLSDAIPVSPQQAQPHFYPPCSPRSPGNRPQESSSDSDSPKSVYAFGRVARYDVRETHIEDVDFA